MNQEYDPHPDQTLETLLSSVSPERRDEILKDPSLQNADFSARLKQASQSPSSVLSAEERAYFFQGRTMVDESSVVEPEMDSHSMYDQAILDPALKSVRRLMFLNGLILAVLVVFMVILMVQQNGLNALVMNTQSLVLRRGAEAGEDKPAFSWDVLSKMDWENQKKALGGVLDSPLTQRNEKIFASYLLAALSFENGDYEEGRAYLVEGVSLKKGNTNPSKSQPTEANQLEKLQ